MTQTVTVRLPVVGQERNLASVVDPLTDLKTALEDTLNGVQPLDQLAWTAASALTLSGGVVTISQSLHTIDTEAAAANDDLVTLNGGSNGDVLVLVPASAARTVTVKHGAGNIQCGGVDVVLKSGAVLVYDGTVWHMVSNSAQQLSDIRDAGTIAAQDANNLLPTKITMTTTELQPLIITANDLFQVLHTVYTDAQFNAAQQRFRRGRGTIGSPAAAQSGDTLGNIQFFGHDGSTFRLLSQVFATAEETVSSSAHGSKLTLRVTEKDSTSPTDFVLFGGSSVVPPAFVGSDFDLGTPANPWGYLYNNGGVVLYNTVGAPATVSNRVALYAVAGEAQAKDGTGNVTPFSPHGYRLNWQRDTGDMPNSAVYNLSDMNHAGLYTERDIDGALLDLETLTGSRYLYREAVPLIDRESWVDAELAALEAQYDDDMERMI